MALRRMRGAEAAADSGGRPTECCFSAPCNKIATSHWPRSAADGKAPFHRGASFALPMQMEPSAAAGLRNRSAKPTEVALRPLGLMTWGCLKSAGNNNGYLSVARSPPLIRTANQIISRLTCASCSLRPARLGRDRSAAASLGAAPAGRPSGCCGWLAGRPPRFHHSELRAQSGASGTETGTAATLPASE